MIFFDVEAGPNLARARELMPPFIESDVPTGNLRDEEKIRAKIAERRASHESSWLDGAALRPETGTVLAIGMLPSAHPASAIIFHVQESNEAEIIRSFWDFFQTTHAKTGSRFAGWGIFHYDLPFLILRSRILEVPVPPLLRQGRYFDLSKFVDVQDDWLLGRSRNEVKCSLDYVARALGCGLKTGDGKDFAAIYAMNSTAALAYLKNDLLLTQAIAAKLCLPDLAARHTLV